MFMGNSLMYSGETKNELMLMLLTNAIVLILINGSKVFDDAIHHVSMDNTLYLI